jgi:hypothetical protein
VASLVGYLLLGALNTITLTLTLSDRSVVWFSSVSSINKTDRRDIAEMLWKVALNTINLTLIRGILLNLPQIPISYYHRPVTES